MFFRKKKGELKRKVRVYYSHSNNKQNELEESGLIKNYFKIIYKKVIIDNGCQIWDDEEKPKDNQELLNEYINSCDAFAFSFIDSDNDSGRISRGVTREIKYAKKIGKDIYCIEQGCMKRVNSGTLKFSDYDKDNYKNYCSITYETN